MKNFMTYTPNYHSKNNLMRFLRSFKYAMCGIKHCAVSEKNFRIQLATAVITFFAGMVLKISANDWFAVLFCCALVLSLEMINTAIEKLCNTVTITIHPVIKQVKDIAAGAVCIASILSFITGCMIFFPKFILLIKHLIK